MVVWTGNGNLGVELSDWDPSDKRIRLAISSDDDERETMLWLGRQSSHAALKRSTCSFGEIRGERPAMTSAESSCAALRTAAS